VVGVGKGVVIGKELQMSAALTVDEYANKFNY